MKIFALIWTDYEGDPAQVDLFSTWKLANEAMVKQVNTAISKRLNIRCSEDSNETRVILVDAADCYTALDEWRIEEKEIDGE